MKALNANHDVKLCPDVFGVVTYVTDYYSKDESGLQTVLTAAVKMCDSNDIKVKMRNVANTFLTHRSMGECEAVYKLVPNMNMMNIRKIQKQHAHRVCAPPLPGATMGGGSLPPLPRWGW